MSKFHDFDPHQQLVDCQLTAQTALNNTQQLAQAHNQADRLLGQLLEQHNNIVDLLMRTRKELKHVERELDRLKQANKPQI